MSEWIACKDLMPPPGVRVLICEGDYVTEATLTREKQSWWEEVNDDTKKRKSEVREWWNPASDGGWCATHWMPLPKGVTE